MISQNVFRENMGQHHQIIEKYYTYKEALAYHLGLIKNELRLQEVSNQLSAPSIKHSPTDKEHIKTIVQIYKKNMNKTKNV